MTRIAIRNLCLVLSALLTSLTGCKTGIDIDHSFYTTDVGDVEIAVTEGKARYDGELFNYEPTLYLNENPEFEDSLLYRPSVFMMDDNGFYYVLDSKDRRIVVFDSSGNYIRTFGNRGKGPGEFESPVLQDVDNGTISVFDFTQRRTSIFTPTGSLLNIYSIPSILGFGHISQRFHEKEQLLITLKMTVSTSEYAYAEFLVRNTKNDSIGFAATNQVKAGIMTVLPFQHGDQRLVVDIPFTPVPTAFYHPARGILLSSSVEPVLEWYHYNGHLFKVIRIQCLSNMVLKEDKQHFDAVWNERIFNVSGQARVANRTQKEALEIPLRKPYWTGVYLDDAGFYWLKKSDCIDRWEMGNCGNTYYILSPSGEYLGSTKVPEMIVANNIQSHFSPLSIKNGHLMAISRNEESEGWFLCVYKIMSTIPELIYP